METDRYEASRRARQSMLRGVYEENRRIRDGAIAERRRRRRVAAWVAGAVLVASLASIVVLQSVRNGDSSGSASVADRPGASTILGADLPVVDELPPDAASLMDEQELRSLLDGSVPLAALFDLQVRTIVIDAGHGGRDPGAIGPGGTREKDVTLDVALRLRRRLQERGYTVLMTRDRDSTVTLRERVEFANARPTDLFVSIHANKFPDEPTNAVETYYFGAHRGEASLRLAGVENAGADYTLADFNEMIGRLTTSTVKLQESRRLAVAIQRSLFRNTRTVSPDVQNWGVKAGPFVVLLGSEAPSVLAEVAVLSNPTEEGRLQTDARREQIALFLEEGILNYLISRTRTGSETES